MSPLAELAKAQLFLHGHLARPGDVDGAVPASPARPRRTRRAWRRLALALAAVLQGR